MGLYSAGTMRSGGVSAFRLRRARPVRRKMDGAYLNPGNPVSFRLQNRILKGIYFYNIYLYKGDDILSGLCSLQTEHVLWIRATASPVSGGQG